MPRGRHEPIREDDFERLLLSESESNNNNNNIVIIATITEKISHLRG